MKARNPRNPKNFGYTLVFLLPLLAGCARNTRVTGTPPPPPPPASIVVVAVGDISCDPKTPQFNGGQGTDKECRMLATSNLAISLKPAAVLLLGDTQYEKGLLSAFQKSYATNWGRKELLDISHTSVGNHEYKSPEAAGYFDYFGARAGERGKGYYSFNLGTWHLIALNSGGDGCKPLSCAPGSDQEVWLRKDLESSSSSCTLAYWHRPLFTSGLHEEAKETRSFWHALHQANADIVLNGHTHHYERFPPQSPKGKIDQENGITEFVVGTGGRDLNGFFPVQQNSLVRNSEAFGVLKLELGEKSYVWQFISEAGQVLDAGSGQCHPKRPPVAPD